MYRIDPWRHSAGADQKDRGLRDVNVSTGRGRESSGTGLRFDALTHVAMSKACVLQHCKFTIVMYAMTILSCTLGQFF